MEPLKVAVALGDSQRSADGKQTRKQKCKGRRDGKGEGKKVKSKAVRNVGLDDGKLALVSPLVYRCFFNLVEPRRVKLSVSQ